MGFGDLSGEEVPDCQSLVTLLCSPTNHFFGTLDMPLKGSAKMDLMWRLIYGLMTPLVLSRHDTPIDNAHIDSFNNCLWKVCPNTNWFMSSEDAREELVTWRCDASD